MIYSLATPWNPPLLSDKSHRNQLCMLIKCLSEMRWATHESIYLICGQSPSPQSACGTHLHVYSTVQPSCDIYPVFVCFVCLCSAFLSWCWSCSDLVEVDLAIIEYSLWIPGFNEFYFTMEAHNNMVFIIHGKGPSLYIKMNAVKIYQGFWEKSELWK